MFVLDTNVLSAAMSTRPAPEVAIWMARHPPELLFTTAVCFAARRSAGRPASMADLMIASIARSRGASVVTRDTSGFEGCGLSLIDPWRDA